MRVEDFRYFIQVVEHGSISKAAEACFITQQGLSKIVSNLEKSLGVKLFFRDGNRIQLTGMGELVIGHIKEMDLLYQRMLDEISQRGRGGEKDLPVDYHIYTTQLISATILPQLLPALSVRYPAARLSIEELSPIEIVDEAEFSENCMGILGISSAHADQSARLREGELKFDCCFQDEMMLGVAEHSPLTAREVISARELAEIPLALCHTDLQFVHNLLEQGQEPTVAMHISNYELYRESVCHNKVAGLTSALRDHYSRHRMQAVPLEKKVISLYGCVYDPHIPQPEFLQELASMVRRELSNVK